MLFIIAKSVINDIKSSKMSITYRRISDLISREVRIKATKRKGKIP